MKIEDIELKNIIPYANNAKEHPREQLEQICNSIIEFGFNDPIGIDENNVIIEGHGRYEALKILRDENMLKEKIDAAINRKNQKVLDKLQILQDVLQNGIPCIRLCNLTSDQKKAYILTHNKLTMNTEFDAELLKIELESLEESGFDLNVVGFEVEELKAINTIELSPLSEKYELVDESKGALFKKFGIPPFSVIDSTKQEWVDIKNKWKELFDGKIGRKNDLLNKEYGTSEFDGAICEVFYKWYTPEKGKIIDCFAGGVTRGAIASKLEYDYTGFDIREEQISANNNLSKKIGVTPKYICSDALLVDDYIADETQDLLFSCPPYADLEVYSDLKGDISNMEYEDFKKIYFEIIEKFCKKLKNNRFAIFTVGEVRGKDGEYIGFVKDTIEAFKRSELKFYNEVIYKEPLGTAPIRSVRPFNINRKITKVHQNILVFYKGRLDEISDNFPLFYNGEGLESEVN